MHGDDFIFTGSRREISWLKAKFEKEYSCKSEVIGRQKGMQHSARFLNRVISFTSKGIEWEADQRLVEGIISGMGVQDCAPSSSPGTKSKPVTKSLHSDMLERRLGGEHGENNAINKLKAKIGQLNTEIARLYAKLKGAPGAKCDVRGDGEHHKEGESDNGCIEHDSARLPESNNQSSWDHNPGGANETVTLDHWNNPAGCGDHLDLTQGDNTGGESSEVPPGVEGTGGELDEVPLEGESKQNYMTQAAKANYL